jgi:hypothetical protein
MPALRLFDGGGSPFAGRVLEPVAAQALYEALGDHVEPEVVAIFPHLDLETFRRLMFWLTFKRPPHGSGTNLTRRDVLDMEVQEIMQWWEELQDVWDKEDAALRQSRG